MDMNMVMPPQHDGEAMMPMMMMQMYFEASSEVTILFSGWKTTNDWQLILSCIFWFLVAFFYEGLKTFREFCVNAYSPTSQQLRIQNETESQSQSNSKDVLVKMVQKSKSTMFTLGHLIQTVLHFFQMLFAYILMLVIMTYNVWLFFSILLGFTAGYFVFIPGTLVVTKHEHCCG